MDTSKANQIIVGLIDGLQALMDVINEKDDEEMNHHAQMVAHAAAVEKEVDDLKKAVWSDKWPAAVNPSLVCDLDKQFDKIERARAIFELMIEEDIKKKKFLDYGCGEGHVTEIAFGYKPELAVGYDIKNQWNRLVPGCLLTTDIEEVKRNGPYDVILLYDVLDHLKEQHPTDVLAQVKEILKDDGKVYVRFHPLSSRHAVHQYYNVNKAYLHLVFEEPELSKIVTDIIPNNGFYQIQRYPKLVNDCGFRVVSRKDVQDRVETFFKIPKIAAKIQKTTNATEFDHVLPAMGVQFIDMVLEKCSSDVSTNSP